MSITNIIHNSEKLEGFSLKQQQDKDAHSHHFTQHNIGRQGNLHIQCNTYKKALAFFSQN